MKRFICEQNVAHFSKLLKDARDSTQKTNTPIHDTDGRLVFLSHHVEDVSDQVTRPSSVVSLFGSRGSRPDL
jgi:hypothetical protein